MSIIRMFLKLFALSNGVVKSPEMLAPRVLCQLSTPCMMIQELLHPILATHVLKILSWHLTFPGSYEQISIYTRPGKVLVTDQRNDPT